MPEPSCRTKNIDENSLIIYIKYHLRHAVIGKVKNVPQTKFIQGLNFAAFDFKPFIFSQKLLTTLQ